MYLGGGGAHGGTGVRLLGIIFRRGKGWRDMASSALSQVPHSRCIQLLRTKPPEHVVEALVVTTQTHPKQQDIDRHMECMRPLRLNRACHVSTRRTVPRCSRRDARHLPVVARYCVIVPDADMIGQTGTIGIPCIRAAKAGPQSQPQLSHQCPKK